jgi:hypothetical protein
MGRKNQSLFILCLIVLVLLAGCGGSGNQGTTPPSPDDNKTPPVENTPPAENKAPATNINDLLTIADVESILDIKGIKLVDRDPSKGAGGDLNFATSSDELVLMAQIGDTGMFESWKRLSINYNEDVLDLGDAAFNGPSNGSDLTIIFVRKGDTAFSLSSFFNFKEGGEAYFSEGDIKDLANIMVSRMK